MDDEGWGAVLSKWLARHDGRTHKIPRHKERHDDGHMAIQQHTELWSEEPASHSSFVVSQCHRCYIQNKKHAIRLSGEQKLSR